MQGVGAKKAKIKGYGLVRDKDGNPRVDDIFNCPPELLAMMTVDEIEKLKQEQSAC